MGLKNRRNELIRSVVSLSLCGALFIGGTLAYFTKTVTSNGNIIKTSSLDLAFEYQDANEEWKTIDSGKNGSIFSDADKISTYGSIKRKIRITNNGDLPFEYDIDIMRDILESNQSDLEKNISVTITPENKEEVVMTLSDALAENTPEVSNGTLLNHGDSHTYTITIAMGNENQPLDADEYSGISIEPFDIKLIATQIERTGAGTNSILGTTNDGNNFEIITIKEDATEADVNNVVNDILNKNEGAQIESSKEEDGYRVYTIRIPRAAAATALDYEDVDKYEYIIVKVPTNINDGKLEGIDELIIDELEKGYFYYGNGKPYVAFKIYQDIKGSRGDYILVEYFDANGKLVASKNTSSNIKYNGMLNQKKGGVVSGDNTGKKFPTIISKDVPAGAYSTTLTSGGSNVKSIKVTVCVDGEIQSVQGSW